MGVELQIDGLWAWCLRSAMKTPTTTNESWSPTNQKEFAMWWMLIVLAVNLILLSFFLWQVKETGKFVDILCAVLFLFASVLWAIALVES